MKADLPRIPFTFDQARAMGLRKRDIELLVQELSLRRVLRGVYQVMSEPDTVESRAHAASLVMPPAAVLCDRTAAWLHGVDAVKFWEQDILPPVETVVLRDSSRIRRTGLRGGERDLAPTDVMEIGRIRVTTPLRTALDLGCALHARTAIAAIDGLIAAHGLTRKDLEAQLPRFRGRRGVLQLRELVAIADPKSESPGESWTRLAIAQAGLPLPIAQYWVTDRGEPVYRLDLAYPKLRICIEYDGTDAHDSEAQREHDSRRRSWLAARGWKVIVVRRDDFAKTASHGWLDLLRGCLIERGVEVGK